jgi:hypothetical protein
MNKVVPTLLVLVALSTQASEAGVLSTSKDILVKTVNTLVVSPLKVAKGLVQGAVGLVADSAKALVK